MKVECPVEGYEECFVEYTEAWTRKEIRTFYKNTKGEEFLSLLRAKITDVHLRLLNGEHVTDPNLLVEDTLDSLQWEVFQWFLAVPAKVVQDIVSLGEAIRRQSSHTAEETSEQ